MKFRNFLSVTASAAMAALLGGCVSFGDCVPMPADAAVDNENMAYVAQAQKAYEQRMQFSKPVMIKPSDKAQLFIAGNICPEYSPQFKRELLVLFENALMGEVGKLRDFRIVGSEARNMSTPGATITNVGDEAEQQNKPYLLSFHILRVYFINVSQGLVQTADLISDLSGGGRDYRRSTRTLRENHLWAAYAQVEVSLTSPDGQRGFTFNKDVTTLDPFLAPRPDPNKLKDAVTYAAHTALTAYSRQFGPPMYVKQTIGGGRFVQISAGSEYGIREGQTVEFFRNGVRSVPTLPGEPPKTETYRIPVARGTVGSWGAPVERNFAWVYVPDNDEPESHRVFTWTSARIVE